MSLTVPAVSCCYREGRVGGGRGGWGRKDGVFLSGLRQPGCISAAFVSKPCRTSGYMAAASIPASQMAGNNDALLFYRV